eukprot:2394953-Rhodomonas_salina.2
MALDDEQAQGHTPEQLQSLKCRFCKAFKSKACSAAFYKVASVIAYAAEPFGTDSGLRRYRTSIRCDTCRTGIAYDARLCGTDIAYDARLC